MVDFAICIQPSEDLRSQIRHHLRRTRNESITHTCYGSLRYCPIGVSIETKRTGESYQDAMLKLQIWFAAQFKRLEILVDQVQRPDQASTAALDLPNMFLPGIITQGHDWIFVAAVRDWKKKEMVRLIVAHSSLHHAYLLSQIFYHGVKFGDTRRLENLYRVIVTLHRLAVWTKSRIMPFYERILSNEAPAP